MTGTRRAGTSLWMQILNASGLPVIGEAFPLDWGTHLREANPHGFYECLLRLGVYYRTNPHPDTGEFVRADESRGHAVKIFMPGVVRTDLSYLDRVIATVRPWREYVGSIERMNELERRRPGAIADFDPADLLLPPALQWWEDNYVFIRDLSVRRFACHVQSFDGLLENPREVLTKVFDWIGPELAPSPRLEAAIACVKPRTRTQARARRVHPDDGIEPHIAEVFDAYYDAVYAGTGLSSLLVERMNEVHEELQERISAARVRVHEAQSRVATLAARDHRGPFWSYGGD